MPITSEPKGPKPPLAGLVKVVPVWVSTLAPIAQGANVLHALVTPAAAFTQAQITSFAARMVAIINAEWTPVISSSWTLNNVSVTALDGSGLTAIAASGVAGGRGPVPLPPQCAAVVSWKAGLYYRGGKPRSYLPGVATGDVVQGTAALSAAYQILLEDASDAMIAGVAASVDFAPGAVALGMPSYFTRGAFRPVPKFSPFIESQVRQRINSQRRRSGKEATFNVGPP